MKTKTKVLVLSLSAVLLVAVSVFSTIAFLKSSDNVVNTFKTGDIGKIEDGLLYCLGIIDNQIKYKRSLHKDV